MRIDKEKNIYDEVKTLGNLIKSEIDKNNISKYDIYLVSQKINGIHIRKTKIEEQTNYHNLSYFIRVFENKGSDKMGCGMVRLNSTNSRSIQKAIRISKSLAKINSGPRYELVSPGKKYPNPKTYDKFVWNDPETFLQDKSEELRKNLSETSAADPCFCVFRTFRKKKMLINSQGLEKLKISTNFGYEFSFSANKNGKMAEYSTNGYIKSAKDLKFDERIPEWASRAKDALKARKPNFYPIIDVIFTPNLVRKALLSTVGYSISGQALYERYSKFKKDKVVATEKFNLLDDGLLENGLGTSPFDSEGNPKQKTLVIDNGVMRNFLFDQKFATLLNEKSTGNAQRKPSKQGYMHIEMNNLIVEPGKKKLKNIVSNSKKAIMVINFPWLRPNAITGDFGANIGNAYMIKDGKLAYSIKGGNISGNIYDMLKNIDAISKETRIIKNAKVPYIKFKNLRLSAG